MTTYTMIGCAYVSYISTYFNEKNFSERIGVRIAWCSHTLYTNWCTYVRMCVNAFGILPMDLPHKLLQLPGGGTGLEVLHPGLAVGSNVHIQLILIPFWVHHARLAGQQKGAQPQRVHLKAHIPLQLPTLLCLDLHNSLSHGGCRLLGLSIQWQ